MPKERKTNKIGRNEKKDLKIEENKKTGNDENKENLENKMLENNRKLKQNKQIIWALVLMVSILLIIIATPYIMKNFINKFTYEKLDFYKTKMGKIIFYSAKIPVTDKKMNIIADYNLNLRNDPRKLKNIPMDISEEGIVFKRSNSTYISLQSDSPKCEDNIIAVVGLTAFLRDFGKLNVKAAMDNKTYANETKFPYVTCSTNPYYTVIHITSGNSTEIKQTGDNCYELVYNNCEINQVCERFITEILKGYMSYFERK